VPGNGKKHEHIAIVCLLFDRKPNSTDPTFSEIAATQRGEAKGGIAIA
jgi:hypothetical protein